MSSLKIHSRKLKNDLTVLCVSNTAIPKVSAQMWYGVGSKNEKNGEKGIAHLIEHLIFKGTSVLSESDISLITHKLSGYTNAFTSYDYTGYLFDFPSQQWQEAVVLLADCMRNASFKQEFLDSEMQAVIQELKMYKDDYISTLIEKMLATMFPDHPYGYPIIGFKQDLWSINRDALYNFYKQYYVPCNATLVVVGDTDPEEVFALAEKELAHIDKGICKKEEFYHSSDLVVQNVTLLRDVKQPVYLLAWVIPGSSKGKDYVLDVLLYILGLEKGSRLYKKLVDDLHLVNELEMFGYDLNEYGVAFLYFQPKKSSNIDHIISLVQQEIMDIAQNGPTEAELMRAIKKAEVDHIQLLENNQKLAYAIGKYAVAGLSSEYVLEYCNYPKDKLKLEVQQMAGLLHPSQMNRGQVLPLPKEDQKLWLSLQELSDEEDCRILSGRSREIPLEAPKKALNLEVKDPKKFNYPHFGKFFLKNGLKVLYTQRSLVPKIDIVIDFKVKSFYDADDKQGITAFVFNLLLEGTEKYPGSSFAQALESYGMSFDTAPGQLLLSLLAPDLEKGLEFLSQALQKATFDDLAIQRVRDQMLADIDVFWDTPTQFSNQIMRQHIYVNHPYNKLSIGNQQTITALSKQDLLQWYIYAVNPQEARMSIVGDFDVDKIHTLLEKYLKDWLPSAIVDVTYPELSKPAQETIDYPINRDQVVLCYAGLSVTRNDEDYDGLLLFDQIFSGGVLGSMSSRLFDLRESSGLFYTISGSLVNKCQQEPGMITIKTIVSNNRLAEAERAIEDVVDHAIDSITEQELLEAKQAVVNSLVDNFASNLSIAQVALIKDIYNLSDDYFDTRAQRIAGVSMGQVVSAVKRWLNSKQLIKIRVGRL